MLRASDDQRRAEVAAAAGTLRLHDPVLASMLLTVADADVAAPALQGAVWGTLARLRVRSPEAVAAAMACLNTEKGGTDVPAQALLYVLRTLESHLHHPLDAGNYQLPFAEVCFFVASGSVDTGWLT